MKFMEYQFLKISHTNKDKNIWLNSGAFFKLCLFSWLFILLCLFAINNELAFGQNPTLRNGANIANSVRGIKSSSNSVNDNYAVGALSGKFQVTNTGAANYNIDIAAPPGTAGISPQLSISYNSQQDNGLLGMGFSMQGLTGITRCAANFAQNGFAHGVDFTDQDRFCFNGEQLVAIRGAYGVDGTEYRTYVNSNTKIISYGRQGNGPANFKIWTKGGQVAEYGFTQDAQVYAQGKGTISTWALNKIIDTAGNYLLVKYNKDEVNGMYYPAEIDYTANDAAKLVPYNSVKFGYERRPDVRDMYRAGSKTRMELRMNEIQAYSGPGLVYDYKLVYEQSPNTGRSRLISIQECGGLSGTCLPPTKFVWKNSENNQWQVAVNYKPPVLIAAGTADNGVLLVDMQGNGLMGIIQNRDCGGQGTWLNNGYGWEAANKYLFPTNIADRKAGRDKGVRVIDFSGSGKGSVIASSHWADPDDGFTQQAWLAADSGWQLIDSYKPPFFIVSHGVDLSVNSEKANVNENNQADHSSNINVRWKNGQGYNDEHNFGFDVNGVDNGARFVDLRGSGLVDVVQKRDDFGGGAWINTGTSWQYAANYLFPDSSGITDRKYGRDKGVRFLDLTGHGLPDILVSYYWHDGDGGPEIRQKSYINNGNGWIKDNSFNAPVFFSNTGDDTGARLVDLNGDGLQDILFNDGSVSRAWINTGHGWREDPNYAIPVPIAIGGKDNGVRFVDLNGDGLPDIIYSYISKYNKVQRKAWINNGHGWSEAPNYAAPAIFAAASDDHIDTGARFIDLTGSGFDDIIQNSEGFSGAWINTAQKSDLLISVVDGLNSHLNLSYRPITDKTIYSKETDAKFPVNDLQQPIYVVAQTQSETVSNFAATRNLNAGLHTTDYTYRGAKTHLQGFGFLGFHQVIAKDNSTGINVTTSYIQDVTHKNIGQITATETRLADGTLIATTQDNWETKTFGSGAVNSTYFTNYTKQIINQTYALDGQWLNTKTQDIQIDDYTNPTNLTITLKDKAGTYVTTTQNTYTNTADTWLIGQVDKTVVTAQAPNTAAISRTSAYVHDANNGMLTQAISEPDDMQYRVATVYERDVYGNVIKTIISGANIDDRISTQNYDDNGRFVIKSTNPLGHISVAEYDSRFGKPTKTTDPNGLVTSYQYDDFGRVISTIYPDATTATLLYSWTDYPGAVYSITTQKTDSTTQTSYLDSLNREIAGTTQSFDGQLIWHTTEYDDLGRIAKQTLPHFAEDQAPVVSMQYDVLGRLLKTINPNQTINSVTYDGLSIISTNAKGQKQTKTYNARGDLLEAIDNHGNHTHYYYNAFSNMIKIVDSAANTTNIIYDKYGHKIELQDPNKGHWSYKYDVLGQLISQTDALKHNTSFKYDQLGRLIVRSDPAGTSGWIYDQAAFGVGKIYQVSGLAGANGKAQALAAAQIIKAYGDGLVNYTKAYKYDQLGRSQQITTTLNGQLYFLRYTYDKDSRIDTTSYPGGINVQNHYNDLGFLIKIDDVNSKKVYWQLNAMDASGHLTSETHSNGLITNYTYDVLTNNLTDIKTILSTSLKAQQKLFPQVTAQRILDQEIRKINAAALDHSVNAATLISSNNNKEPYQQLHFEYDPIGNISSRADPTYNTKESFNYDDLNRLSQNDLLIGNRPAITTYKYDDLGNLTYKSDVGTYTYGGRGAGPHAVTEVSGKKTALFTYNANGDQVTATIDGTSRSMLYTSYSKPYKIIMPTATIAFYYNADRDSFERVDQQGPASTTTFYMDNYELVNYSDGFGHTYVEQKYYLGPHTIYVSHTDGITKAVTTHIYETLQDNLGSVTDITDENANLVQHFSYTPFGQQTQTKGDKLVAPITHHGFTGHEQIELANLIHMKGRIYDPIFGRFLTADPEVQDPENSQSLNRYSYCVNNPLRYTDPTGYNFFGDIISDIGRAISDVAEGVGRAFVAIMQNKQLGLLMQTALAAFEPQFVPLLAMATTAASAGSFGDVLKAGAISELELEVNANAFGAAGDLKSSMGWADSISGQITSAAVHGVVGGGISLMEGGKFQDGFLSSTIADFSAGAINSVFGMSKNIFCRMERVAAAGVIGGTAAALGGGNFFDGFETGAADRLFNDEAHLGDAASNAGQKGLTADEGESIADDAQSWERTPYAYAGTAYVGAKAESLVFGDCSGITHAVYHESGYDYPYMTANRFVNTAGGGHFMEVNKPQRGDVVAWGGKNHHLAIYDGNGQMWTTHIHVNHGEFGRDKVSNFSTNFKQHSSYFRYIP